jgi:3-dehydroquinate dehydratase/shikimate dehydrogenase
LDSKENAKASSAEMVGEAFLFDPGFDTSFDAVTPVLVCESVRATTLPGLIRARNAAEGADLVELRLDGVADPDPVAALAGRTRPTIVTCRPTWEGGAFDGDEGTRERLLDAAVRAGAEFVDIEWQAPWAADFLRRCPSRVVVSSHDFAGIPSDLQARAAAMSATGAAVVKIAVTATRLRDLEPLLALQRAFPRDRQFVLIGMGPAGATSRILPQRFGSAWTYAGNGVAPGQIPTRRLVHEYRVRASSAATAVFGVVGNPISHSLSPVMHNTAFAQRGIDAVYLPLEAADFDDFLWAADALDVVGVSVTAPFKTDALGAAKSVDAAATAVGAVNTLRRSGDGGWSATNTDGRGFLAPLSNIVLKDRRVAVLGGGGAAQAVIAALTARGADVTVHTRRPDAARVLADRFGVRRGGWPPDPHTWDLLVNTTPVGTWPDVERSPLEASIVHEGVVYDLVYNPPETALLRAAQSNGCSVIGGLEMLVHQAAAQFQWWTGQPAPIDMMRSAALRRLEEFREPEPETKSNR